MYKLRRYVYVCTKRIIIQNYVCAEKDFSQSPGPQHVARTREVRGIRDCVGQGCPTYPRACVSAVGSWGASLGLGFLLRKVGTMTATSVSESQASGRCLYSSPDPRLPSPPVPFVNIYFAFSWNLITP